MTRIEDYGLLIAQQQKWVKKLRDDIFEIRSKQGSDCQRALYFHKVGIEYVITHGFTKKSDRTPDSEIDKAKRMMTEYLKEQTAQKEFSDQPGEKKKGESL